MLNVNTATGVGNISIYRLCNSFEIKFIVQYYLCIILYSITILSYNTLYVL